MAEILWKGRSIRSEEEETNSGFPSPVRFHILGVKPLYSSDASPSPLQAMGFSPPSAPATLKAGHDLHPPPTVLPSLCSGSIWWITKIDFTRRPLEPSLGTDCVPSTVTITVQQMLVFLTHGRRFYQAVVPSSRSMLFGSG